jgi:hypothetical protein
LVSAVTGFFSNISGGEFSWVFSGTLLRSSELAWPRIFLILCILTALRVLGEIFFWYVLIWGRFRAERSCMLPTLASDCFRSDGFWLWAKGLKTMWDFGFFNGLMLPLL